MKSVFSTTLLLFFSFFGTLEAQYDSAFDWEGMDHTINPADDFYHYAVGEWIRKSEIPEGHPRWGRFLEIRKNNTDRLRTLMKEGFPVSSHSDALIQSYYESYLNTSLQNQLGLSPLQPYLNQIDAIDSVDSLFLTLADFQQKGLSPLFRMSVVPHPHDNKRHIISLGQGALNLPDDEIYISSHDTDANKNSDKRLAYQNYLSRSFSKMGYNSQDAIQKAGNVFSLEKEMASAFYTKEERRDVARNINLFSLDTLNNKTSFPLADLLNEKMKLNIAEVNVENPTFLKSLENITKLDKLEAIKDYLRFSLVNEMSPMLGDEFFTSHFEMYQTALLGVKKPKPLEERAIDNLNAYLGDALGKVYVSRFFSAEKKKEVDAMVETSKEALIDSIGSLNWMQESTKATAIKKVEKMIVQVAYPDDKHWTDYTALKGITASQALSLNTLAALQFEQQREFDKLRKGVDKEEWPWSPQTVNACNCPDLNKINFPAGILQFPFFTADPAVNWGAFGMVICHEIIHSFDDQGRKFDVDGNVADWWTEEDGKAFDAHAKVIVDQFNEYSITFSDGTSKNVRGELCQGENIADLGGMTVAYEAFKLYLKDHPLPNVRGFTPEQRFFLGYAQVWAYLSEEDFARGQLDNDPHSPPVWRVNGALSQLPEFREAFNLPENCSMVIPETKRSKMWVRS
jgi:putative endopeptidase